MKIKEKTFREWMRNNYTNDELRSVAKSKMRLTNQWGWVWHGVEGIETLYDANCLYDRFSRELWAIIVKWAEEGGYGPKGIFKYMADLMRDYAIFGEEYMKAAIVWYVARMMAWELLQGELIASQQ